MYFEFYLDDLLIEEPEGFSDIVLNMKRDDVWHGIFFEASTSDLIFYGDAAEYLREKKETQGMRADVTFRVLQACGVYDEPEAILEGKLDFRKYSASCGTSCIVTIPVEQTGCVMTLRNRYDQKVDLDSNVAFNKTTALEPYDRLNFEMEIAPKELEAGTDGSVGEAGDTVNMEGSSPGGGYVYFVRPTYTIERDNSIATGQLTPISNWETNGTSVVDSPISPQLLFEDTINCFDGNLTYSTRKKGIYNITDDGLASNLTSVRILLLTWDGTGNIFDNHTIVDSIVIFSGSTPTPASGSFDGSLSGTLAPTESLGIYAVVEFGLSGVPSASADISVTFDDDTFFTLLASKLCPATTSNVYMVNEAFSRVTEAITDGCLKVKSNYYGRTDSEPYASTEDGCGALRVLTSGLKIRRAENARFFASLKDLFEGHRGIDNIGMGIEDNPNLPNTQWLRIEPVDHFYQDTEVLSLPYVPNAQIAIQEQLHYSLIKTGYKKWEVESINGLNEFNSNREYRTSLSTVSNTLDLTSAFVAGGYPWEITRQQSFAETGQADTKFDNDTFIACVERDAYGFHIEQGNIENPTNIFSPDTAYNWRIRPLYNLMRWFKSIANSYPNLVDTTNKLFFSQGTGNFLAGGEIGGAYPECKLENTQKPENKDLYISDFADEADAIPIWKPEYLTLKYPLSVKNYRTIQAKPYGYISVGCGNSAQFIKGFIREIRYNLNRGEADFILKIKYQ
jgi:hypothetical protein